MNFREQQLTYTITISSGGGYHGRHWLTKPMIKKILKRWTKRSYDEGLKQRGIVNNWIPDQCISCFWFGALDSDYGLCCNEKSPCDGRLVFEHGGCINYELENVITPKG